MTRFDGKIDKTRISSARSRCTCSNLDRILTCHTILLALNQIGDRSLSNYEMTEDDIFKENKVKGQEINYF